MFCVAERNCVRHWGFAGSMGVQAEVANLVKSLGQDVTGETAKQFDVRHRGAPITPGTNDNAIVVDHEQAII